MPADTMQSDGIPKIYYELKPKFQIPVIDKITKVQLVDKTGSLMTTESPAITYYSQADKEVFYKSKSFGGKPVRFDLWDVKKTQKNDGTYFTSRHFSLEFRYYDQFGELIAEVLKINFNSTIGKSIIAKLASATDFEEINITVGQFENEEKKQVKWANVYEGKGKNKLKARVVPVYPDKEYGDEIIALPPIRYVKKVQGGTVETLIKEEASLNKEGRVIISEDWEAEVAEIYEDVCGAIKTMVQEYNQKHPEIPTITVAQKEEANEDYIEEEYEPDEEEAPVAKTAVPAVAPTKTPVITKIVVADEIDLDEDTLNDDEVLE